MEKMNEQLEVGFTINTRNGIKIVIEKFLGGGGQGDVYLVDYAGTKKALKWYKELGSDPNTFYENIQENISKGSPSPIFLWPEDITEWKDGTFGYVMELKPDGYHELTEFLVGNVSFASWKCTIDACLDIVTGFRLLHNRGYSYQDLNDGNFFINPKNGKVKIADNDNVAPSGENLGILGKPRFMAPEIVRDSIKNRPNTPSDRYSLALILFMILCGGHPLEGKIGTPFVLTPKVAETIYGTNAIFVFDPDDNSNEPIPTIHKNVINLWRCMPTYMKDIFVLAFNKESLYNARRVKELDWIKVLTRFRSDIVRCSCGNEVFTENAKKTHCDKCGRAIEFRNKIAMPEYMIPAVSGSRIYRVQLGTANADEALNPIAAIVAKNDNPNMLGIRNLSEVTWSCTTTTGNNRKLLKKEVAPIKAGIKFKVKDTEFELQ